MNSSEYGERLSRIQTHWKTILQARQGLAEDQQRLQDLLVRYYRAVYRYLLGTVRDADAAQELAQEFAVRFLRGDFKNADPQRGRFRDFLKTAVRHLVIDYWRRQGKQAEPLPEVLCDSSDDPASAMADLDRSFMDSWREELLARTWDALAEVESETGQPYHAVLRTRTEQPDASSAELAETIGRCTGRSYSIDAIRQLLHRARQRFAQLLVEEVGVSLRTSDPDTLEGELCDLGLLDYCRSALGRRDQPG